MKGFYWKSFMQQRGICVHLALDSAILSCGPLHMLKALWPLNASYYQTKPNCKFKAVEVGAKIRVKVVCNLLASGQHLHLAFQYPLWIHTSHETEFLMVTQNVFSLQLSWKYLSKETLIRSSSTAYYFQGWILNFAAFIKNHIKI